MTTYTLTQESIRDYVDSQKSRIGDGVSPNEAFEYIAAQQVLTQYDIDDDETERGHVGGAETTVAMMGSTSLLMRSW